MKPERTVLTVTEITRRIKLALESGFSSVVVQGELSNVRLHSSGHLYFSLKDEGAQLSGVMWRSKVSALSIDPADGMKVIITGRVTVYEVRGSYQLEAYSIRPVGAGELQAAFERLKQKLAEEGLFDVERKRPLPQFPETIGIITSPTGAVIRDIMNILRRRFPAVEVILLPVRVQGSGAPGEIAGAIAEFNRFKRLDVIVLARGGGSMEDLWAFNEESVARAIAASHVPIVSAIGHETDFTIADFAADLRAPTPSSAAELVVPDRRAVVDSIRNNWYTMHSLMVQLLESYRKQIRHLLGSYSFNKPVDRLRQFAQRVDELENKLFSLMSHRLTLTYVKVKALSARLSSINPDSVLRRGYTMVYKQGVVVPSAQGLGPGDDVSIRFHDGSVRSTVSGTKS